MLKPLDEATDASDYGSLVHAGMHFFLQQAAGRWPADASERLRAAMDRALREAGLRPALQAWWKPRLDRIAAWVAEVDANRRALSPPVSIAAEAAGLLELTGPGGTFRLTGRADRIDRRADGTLAIFDYKTGTVPSQSSVDAGLAPQLLLEAAMAAAGAFGPDAAGQATELIYWHLTGGASAGEVRTLFKGDPAQTETASAEALVHLRTLIDAFDQEARAYLSHPHPGQAPRFSDYAQLARVAEWSAAGEE